MIPAVTLAALCADTYQHKVADVARAGLHIDFTPAYDNAIVAAFRGSADVEDWVLNFRQTEIRAVKYPKLDAMPEGFADDVLDAYADIRKTFGGYQRIVLTGHSRGGSQAQILAALLTSDGVGVDQLTTFGAARVGELGGFAKALPGDDFVNGNDPVPDTPPWAVPARARHFIGAQRHLVPACVEDHLVVSYQKALAAYRAAA